jgi:hypothetical protein
MVRYFGDSGAISIPSFIESIKVCCFLGSGLEFMHFESPSVLKRIGTSAFFDSKLKSVFIPKSVEILCHSCFSCSLALTEVIYESDSKLQQIETKVFSSTALKRIAIPQTVREIDDGSFTKCASLEEVVFVPGSVLERIGRWAFSNSGLTRAVIPQSVRFIHKGCFAGCVSLAALLFEEESRLEMVEDLIVAGCVALSWVELPNGIRLASRIDRTENARRVPLALSRRQMCDVF